MLNDESFHDKLPYYFMQTHTVSHESHVKVQLENSQETVKANFTELPVCNKVKPRLKHKQYGRESARACGANAASTANDWIPRMLSYCTAPLWCSRYISS